MSDIIRLRDKNVSANRISRTSLSTVVIVKSNYISSINRPYPTSYSSEPTDTLTYSVGNRVTVTTKRNGRYFHPTFGGDGEWFSAYDLRCPEKP
jgi:hypothetical protein